MAYKIEKRIIPGLTKWNLSAANLVVAHDAGNANNVGPDSLENEIYFMTKNWQNAFTSHFVGGGGRIVQLGHVGKYQYGAGTKGNSYAYAQVELARTDNAETFKLDYAAYVWILRDLAAEAGIPKTLDTGSSTSDKGIKTHNWVTENLGGTTHTDPYSYLASFGVSKEQFKKDVEAGTAKVEPAPPHKVESVNVRSYLIKGDKGAKVKDLQKKLIKLGYDLGKYGADGVYGDDTVKAVKAFQAHEGIKVDGIYGVASKKQMRTAKSIGKLKVDGYLGKATITALQHYFKTPTDGIISKPSTVIKSLQKLLKVKADGYMGAITIKAMQKRFGTPADGVISKPSTVIKELQRRLNRGKL